MRLSFFAALSLSLLTTAAMAPAVSAQPDYRSSVPGWDSRGWVLLGEKQVDRRVDQDTIVVGRQAGNFTNLTLAVLDSDLELLSINILFDDGSSASPAVNYFFREGTRTRAIDLPGNNRFIREIRLKYRNTPGGGKARVQVYGRQGNTGAQPSQPPPPPPPPVSSWNPTGWVRIGGAGIKARNPNLTIKAARRAGVFTELTVHVPTQDLFINKVFVTYDNGTTFGAKVNHAFAGNDRTVVVALPRNTRHIRNIRFTHNAPIGLNPTIEVWGRGAIAAPPAPPVVTPTPMPPSPPAFDPTGWRLLGETRVEGRRDRDVIRMQPGKMAMRRIVIVVTDSDLDMQSVLVRFGKGQVFTPNVKHFFREGTRSRVIDLPGDVNRVFEIELKYGNTWGGGRARVQVYGQ
jgi:hypothetical protein